MVNSFPLPVDEDGTPILDVPHLREVTIANLAEVAEHRITPFNDTVSHFVRFHNGGFLCFAYSMAGQLLELRAKGVVIQVTATGTAIFRMITAEEIAANPGFRVVY